MSDQVQCERIKASTLGEELEMDECQTLAGVMKLRRLKAGERLIEEDQADDTLFVLVEGRLGVSTSASGGEATVYTMRPGECAGTRAFVDRTPRKASLRALEDSVVYTLVPDDFESLLDTNPWVVYKVMRAIFRVTHSNLMRMNLESEQLLKYITKTGGRY